jgi:hypothetical protein
MTEPRWTESMVAERLVEADDGTRQSRTMSFFEAVTNVVIGFLLAFMTQIAAFPLFGLEVSIADNLLIGSIFTAVSILRSFSLRRLFEAIRARQRKESWRTKDSVVLRDHS